MELKNIFKMTKTDRYTQDGRDELAKLQETEDVTYKTGDISQKTGLQKQPDGSWAPPKGSSAAKHQKAMEGAKKVGIVNKVPAGWKKAEGVTTTPNGYVAITNGGSLFPKEGQAKRDVKFIKQEDFEKSAATQPKAKFDEYGLPDNETISMKDEFLKKEKVADPNKLSNAEFNALAKKLDSELGIGNMERAQELLVTPAENKPVLTQTDWVKQKMEQYKDLSPEQKKDAMYAASYEGITIGGTQNGMERAGWDLIQADDDVNVYAKPDGSKVTMKHDGKTITSSEYEAPGSAESKPQKDPKEIIATPGKLATQEQTDAATAIADKNSYSFETMMEKFPIQKIQQFANSKVDDFEGGIDEYIEFKAEGRTGVDMEEVGKDFAKLINHNVARRIWNGYTNGSLKVDEKGFFKPAASADAAPRQLTGDCRIRIRKEKPKLTGDTKIRIKK